MRVMNASRWIVCYRKTEKRVAELQGLGIKVKLVCVGKKGYMYFKRRPQYDIAGDAAANRVAWRGAASAGLREGGVRPSGLGRSRADGSREEKELLLWLPVATAYGMHKCRGCRTGQHHLG